MISPDERPEPGGADAVLLAQYSLASRAEELSAVLGLPVYAGPQAAARALRSALGDGGAPCSE